MSTKNRCGTLSYEKSHPRDLSRACSQCSLGGMYALVPFSNLFHILSIYLILGF